MNNLKKFGIESLSYSSLTSFHYNRANWILEKLLKYKFPYSPSAIRGFAVEKAVEQFYIHDKSPLQCALDYYDKKIEEEAEQYGFDNDEDELKYTKSVKKERGVIEKIVAPTLMKLEEQLQKPSLLTTQKKIECEIAGLKFTGYIDFHFYSMDTDIIVDLKTANQKTSVKHSHQMQQSIYWYATKMNPALLYTYPTGTYYKKLSNMQNYFKMVEEMAIAMDRFLGMVESTQEIIALTKPDFDHWSWNSQTKDARKEVFGI